MKKFIFLPALIAVVSILTGCNDQVEFHCPYGQCVDDFGYCVPCYPGGVDSGVNPGATAPQWETLPGHGLIYLHTGAGINHGFNTMIDEYGMSVIVNISSNVYGPASRLAQEEIHAANQSPWIMPRPLLVSYTFITVPNTGGQQVIRSAFSVQICTMCWF